MIKSHERAYNYAHMTFIRLKQTMLYLQPQEKEDRKGRGQREEIIHSSNVPAHLVLKS